MYAIMQSSAKITAQMFFESGEGNDIEIAPVFRIAFSLIEKYTKNKIEIAEKNTERMNV